MKSLREYWRRKCLKVRAYCYEIYPEDYRGETDIARMMLEEKLTTPPHRHIKELKKYGRKCAEYRREEEGIKLRRTRKNVHIRHLVLSPSETEILRNGILRVRADGTTYIHKEEVQSQ